MVSSPKSGLDNYRTPALVHFAIENSFVTWRLPGKQQTLTGKIWRLSCLRAMIHGFSPDLPILHKLLLSLRLGFPHGFSIWCFKESYWSLPTMSMGYRLYLKILGIVIAAQVQKLI